MNESISILLGAGFSAPMGYPVGNRLNELLLNCTGNEFTFHSSGAMAVSVDGIKPDFGYPSSYEYVFEFCRELIKYFNATKGYFDYEEFYDFTKDKLASNSDIQELAKPFLRDFESLDQLIFSLDNIYSQLISYYLKDGNGKTHYDDMPYLVGSIFPGYTGIFNCFKKISENSFINVHTLNHDLFFESINNSDWIKGELCDGFHELGSPYYGNLEIEGRSYKIRLARYTGVYDKKYRLYKLHGSRDYGVYYTSNNSVSNAEKYLKTRYKVGFGDLFKEKVNAKGEFEYENCWFNYHADFLTGTTSKIERYKEPLLYKILFDLFKSNLKQASMLIILAMEERILLLTKCF